MSNTNATANSSFRGMSRTYAFFQKTNTILQHTRLLENTRVDNNLVVSRRFPVGGKVLKDMRYGNYNQEINPSNLQDVLFPGMADLIEDNIVLGDKEEGQKLRATYWDDLGNDVFDDWGYFFIYDVQGGKYYYPLLTPMNRNDGVVTTQTFTISEFEVVFQITHGWREFGIFMMDVNCFDSDFQFRFGAYGNLGSDGDEDDYDMTAAYTFDETPQTLFYHHHGEIGDNKEILYSYFIPYKDSDKTTKAYASLYNPEDTDDNSLITKVLTEGVKIYFAKQNDVKQWVITDITEGDFPENDGEIVAEGDIIAQHDVIANRYVMSYGDVVAENNMVAQGAIVAKGHNLGNKSLVYLNDENYTLDGLVETYFISNATTEDRYFFLPSADTLSNSIPNCQDGISFRFTINNYNNYEGGFSWIFSFEESDMNHDAVKNLTIPPGAIVTYLVILRQGEGFNATLLQESEPFVIFG